jgi:hypothetical protein
VNAELDAGRAADRASGAAVALKGLQKQVQGAQREAAELREARLEADAAHNKERLQHAGLLVRGPGATHCVCLLSGALFGVAGRSVALVRPGSSFAKPWFCLPAGMIASQLQSTTDTPLSRLLETPGRAGKHEDCSGQRAQHTRCTAEEERRAGSQPAQVGKCLLAKVAVAS